MSTFLRLLCDVKISVNSRYCSHTIQKVNEYNIHQCKKKLLNDQYLLPPRDHEITVYERTFYLALIHILDLSQA